MTTFVVGVDPGAEHTGIALTEVGERTGQLTLMLSRTIHRPRPKARGVLPVDDAYLADIQRAVENMVWPQPPGAVHTERLVVGVEMVHSPTGVLGLIDPAPLIACAVLAGYTLAYWREPADGVYQVPPAHNGKGAYASYPEALVTAQERVATGWATRRAGDGKLRHERSAWDCARTAEQLDRRNRRTRKVTA